MDRIQRQIMIVDQGEVMSYHRHVTVKIEETDVIREKRELLDALKTKL